MGTKTVESTLRKILRPKGRTYVYIYYIVSIVAAVLLFSFSYTITHVAMNTLTPTLMFFDKEVSRIVVFDYGYLLMGISECILVVAVLVTVIFR